MNFLRDERICRVGDSVCCATLLHLARFKGLFRRWLFVSRQIHALALTSLQSVSSLFSQTIWWLWDVWVFNSLPSAITGAWCDSEQIMCLSLIGVNFKLIIYNNKICDYSEENSWNTLCEMSTRRAKWLLLSSQPFQFISSWRSLILRIWWCGASKAISCDTGGTDHNTLLRSFLQRNIIWHACLCLNSRCFKSQTPPVAVHCEHRWRSKILFFSIWPWWRERLL